jgi:3-oxoacyl-[acyl-carrier protein] reductase
MSELDGRIAVVTGAARGIGSAIAQKLASMGARLVLTARDAAGLHQVEEQIRQAGGEANAIPCDLLDFAAIEALGKTVETRYGRCDILVNNAGVGKTGTPLHETPLADWDQMMGTNLRGPFLTIRAFAPMMIAFRYGHIINISSLAGRNPLPNGAAYAASKWGLNGLTYSVAEELRQYGIRVSVIAPGSVNTGFGDGSRGKDPAKKVQPADVAAVVAMLVTQAPQAFISEVLMRPTQKP